jgi:septum formation protein
VNPVLCLASASSRRRELLVQIGVPHTLATADIDETPRSGESPRHYVQRMAQEKAQAVWKQQRDLPVLTADTTVVLDGIIHGKPRDREEGLQMLAKLSARTHEVLTAVALAHAPGVLLQLSTSAVQFRAITPQEAAAYWDTGEPRDKAGCYAIQGLGAVFVQSLAGSYSGVMGLPLYETAQLLRSAGLSLWCKIRG